MNKKSCTIYLVRHGLTDWNKRELIQGHSDIPLNFEGEKQAQRLARKLKHINFSSVYSSDLSRAKRTAEIIAKEQKLLVKTAKALRERNYGHFEGKHKSKFKEIDNALLTLSKEEKYYYKHHPSMESTEELMSRFFAYLREISVLNLGKSVLVVSHGGPMGVFLSLLKKIDIEPKNIKIVNLAYIELESDGVEFLVRKTTGIKIT